MNFLQSFIAIRLAVCAFLLVMTFAIIGGPDWLARGLALLWLAQIAVKVFCSLDDAEWYERELKAANEIRRLEEEV